MSSLPDTTLRIVREFKASLDRVWDVWSDMDRAGEWWGPEGCETLGLEAEVRVGGTYRWRLRTPMGEMTARGEYREIVPRQRLVYTWRWDDDPQWENHDSLVTVEFRAKDANTTELILTHSELPTKESRDNHIGGWESALDRLQKLVERR